MKEFGQWCLENISLLLSILVFVLSFILAILRKKPTVNLIDEIKKVALEVLPLYISKAEETSLTGVEKFNYVFIEVEKFLIKKYGIGDCAFLKNFLSIAIENILKSPQATKYK